MTDQPITRTWTEAPASLTVKFMRAGFDCMLTLRAETGSDCLTKLEAAIAWLGAHDAYPTPPHGSNGNGKAAEAPALSPSPSPAPTLAGGQPDPTWCAIHGVSMTRRERNGEVWFSHKHGEGYCKGGAK